ncbi:MAG: hypothetical protein HY717_03410 [Planctomycetes bacterium]|nr:hypothetical protein [Planctomycetota bacterium]
MKMELSDEWLAELEEDILLRRGRIDRPRGLGGFEKIRQPNPARGKGRRGGLRVYFLRLQDLGAAVLALISDKDIEENISSEDQKVLRRLAEELKKELSYEQESARRRRGRRG